MLARHIRSVFFFLTTALCISHTYTMDPGNHTPSNHKSEGMFCALYERVTEGVYSAAQSARRRMRKDREDHTFWQEALGFKKPELRTHPEYKETCEVWAARELLARGDNIPLGDHPEAVLNRAARRDAWARQYSAYLLTRTYEMGQKILGLEASREKHNQQEAAQLCETLAQTTKTLQELQETMDAQDKIVQQLCERQRAWLITSVLRK